MTPPTPPQNLQGPGRPVVMSLDRASFDRIASLIHKVAGLSLPESKTELAYSRLVRRIRSLGLKGFPEYCDHVESPAGADELKLMINALTTHTTRFHREPHHFDYLEQSVLPQLVMQARKGGRVRIWSAGCSSGEEVYQIAFSVLDQCPEALSLDLRILATDIDLDILEKAQNGVFSSQSIEVVPKARIDAHFDPAVPGTTRRRVNDRARALISFRELNLNATWPIRGPFDVIFCRNVAIYFDQDVQDRLWARFDAVLAPGGVLFIGHSERLSAGLKDSYDLVGVTAYRRIGAATARTRVSDRIGA